MQESRTPQEWLSPYVASDADPFDRRKAAHLMRRAGFGASSRQIDELCALGPQRAVERLLAPPDAGADRAFAELMEHIGGELLDLSREDDLQAWWVYRMLHSPRPLVEKMTLFWHGHFATSIRKVERAALMRRQNELFRSAGLGKLRALLLAVSRDPAMIIWLDNRANRKGKPNENYARELMELFTLGVGNYTESDVKDVARAFTGWHLRDNNEFNFDKGQHDDGTKTVLGHTGNLGGEEVIDILLQQPACAQLLAARLFRFLVAPTAPAGVVDLMAERLRASDHDLRTMVGDLLASRIFFAASSYRARIKSPCELLLGIVNGLELKADARQTARAMVGMGQALFAPPTVKGWDGERGWVSAQWLVNRANAAMGASALRGGDLESRFDATPLLKRRDALGTPAAAIDALCEMLLDGPLPDAVRQPLVDYMTRLDGAKRVDWKPADAGMMENKVRGATHLIMTLPEFQLA